MKPDLLAGERAMRSPAGATRNRRKGAGFTLIELTVALVAGLIVALAIVGLSREATRTFHEEIRSSAAEATLRIAVDRLRADLQRAAYMSTGNIVADPFIAHAPGNTNVASILPGMKGILRLSGIYLQTGGSFTNTQTLSQVQSPALSPDAIEIAGNLTSSEQFEVQTVQLAVGACRRITLSANSPALYRVMAVGAAAQSAELNNIFQPIGGSQFIVRLVDDTGRAQYLATCNETPTAGFAGVTAYVDVDNVNTPVLSPSDTQSMGGVSNTPAGRAWINPVQIVRWEIVNAAQEPTQYQVPFNSLPLQPGTQDPNKYDLVRSYVDATDTPIAATMEVIAEYAVDLDFAFSVEASLTPPTPQMVTYPFDDPTDNQLYANSVATSVTTKPQHIRVIRARVVTRAAQPDRTLNIPLTNIAVGNGTQAFLYRYCVVPPCATNDGTLRWARTRTMTTEVSLANQAGDVLW